jgi:hypothetical protein
MKALELDSPDAAGTSLAKAISTPTDASEKFLATRRTTVAG